MAENPKHFFGIRKVSLAMLPIRVLYEVAVAFLEGALKYGRHNYRATKIRASDYYGANHRHMDDWYEGQDLDPASQLSHVTKAIASLMVLRDAMIRGQWVDDRPPRSADGWIDELNEQAAALVERYPDPPRPFTQVDHPWVLSD